MWDIPKNPLMNARQNLRVPDQSWRHMPVLHQESNGALEESPKDFAVNQRPELRHVRCRQHQHVTELPAHHQSQSDEPCLLKANTEQTYACAVPKMLVTMGRPWMPSNTVVLRIADRTHSSHDSRIARGRAS